jgi:4-diphosphocytidyl-2-C-methyl-D-erythritol kinase
MIRLRTPAKINLSLAIFGRRPDGFHEIESWAVPIGLYDELIFSEAGSFELIIRKSPASLEPDRSNLVWRAAEALADIANVPLRGRIDLSKMIPIGAGLGGGSSDAAATLLGLNKLWQLHWPIQRLTQIAAELGSDVPFFLEPKSAIMRGRGELIEPVTTTLRGWVSLICPKFELAPAGVYAKHAALNAEHNANQSEDRTSFSTLINLSPREVMPMLFNELEPAAFAIEPRLAALHAQINSMSGQPVRMTGSGSTLFSLFDSRMSAEIWNDALANNLDSDVEMRVVPLQ